jgi:hypothetical protein
LTDVNNELLRNLYQSLRITVMLNCGRQDERMHDTKIFDFSWNTCMQETTWETTYKWQDNNEVHVKDKVCEDVN